MWSSMEAPMMWRSKHRTATCCDMLRHAATLKSRLSTPPNVGQNPRPEGRALACTCRNFLACTFRNWLACTFRYSWTCLFILTYTSTCLFILTSICGGLICSQSSWSYICPHSTPPNPTPGSTSMRASVCVPFLVCKCQGTLTSHPTPSPPHPVVLECASEWNLVCGLEGFARPENRWF